MNSARSICQPFPTAPQAVELVASWFRALSDPGRLKILQSLRGGTRTLAELAAVTGMTQGNLSRHVQNLSAACIITRRREGASVRCEIADTSILDLCDLVGAGLKRRFVAKASMLASTTNTQPESLS